MKLWSRVWLAWLVILLLATLPGSVSLSLASDQAQENAARQKAADMLAKMTPEERIGQLFLVTFQGSTFDETSQIYDLIVNHHVGGFVLLRSNDNFDGTENAAAQAQTLNRLLQETEWKGSRLTLVNPETGSALLPQYIPLFIGISQEGDQYPNDQLIGGLTPLPGLMAIGATWDTALARQVGAVMGSELSATGFNLYLGPSLDVLELPYTQIGADLGVRSFGGSAHWVGQLGQAYITGLHEGSNNRMAVIAKHFPGRGSADREPDEEIATVRKTLEQLLQVDLAPFFAVTGDAEKPEEMADGLLVSHVRYQGLQGNIRATTRPVSSDAAALETLLGQPAIAKWRDSGGVMVSDNLGSPAIQRFYDPTGGSLDARMVAREAFLAGNDLIYLDRFISTYDLDAYTTLIRTLESFGQKYREDKTFAQRVDASVERILTLKYELYPEFTTQAVFPDQAALEELGTSQQVTLDVARQAITLISPSASDLNSILPSPPNSRERILFLTDVLAGRLCSTCVESVTMPVDALQNAVLRLYGTRAGGLLSQNLMSSYTFSDLNAYISGGFTEPPPIENDFAIADWVVVSMLQPDADRPETLAFQRLLSDRPDLLRNKRVIVFAFGAPYYLDATEISKLTAYYGAYGKTGPFVEAAARVLYQEQPVTSGALPVSVPGVAYNLNEVTLPHPNQIIQLLFDLTPPAGPAGLPAAGTAEPTPVPLFKVEDLIPLRTGVIYDFNHNPVPDGTPVRFLFTVFTENGSTQQQVEVETVEGVARTSYRIKHSGILDIQAATMNGARTSLLRVDTVTGGITQVAPTPEPTNTPTPTTTPTTTPTVTPTATPTPIPPSVGFSDWFFVFAMLAVGAIGVAYVGVRQAVARWGLRWALCGVIGGLLAYNYLAMGLPGSEDLLRQAGTPGVLVVTFVGITLGWGIGWLWKQFSLSAGKTSDRSPGYRTPGDRPATGPKSQSG